MSMTCPVCDASTVAVVQEGVEGGKVTRRAGDVRVLRCADCDLDFLETWDDMQRAYNFYAHDEYVYVPDIENGSPPTKFDEYQYYFDHVEPYLGPTTQVLDIGCGDGRFLKMVRPHVGRTVGTEVTPAHIDRLRAEGIEVWDRPIERIEAEAFDIVCMHAVLEHVPKVGEFLQDIKRFLAPRAQVFITVPHGLDPLTSFYDVEGYRRFFYREYHFYYFTERSLSRLMARAGYRAECRSSLMASLTNHFHWLHRGEKQRGRSEFTQIALPRPLRREQAPSGARFMDVLNEVDDLYRRRLAEEGVGDLLHCRATLA